MPKATLLVEGYANKNTQKASPSAVLIQDHNLNIIIDPGIDRATLLSGLKKQSLNVEDIDYVVVTHYHPDHCALIGIFPNAQIIDDSEICSFDGHYQSSKGKIPGTNIKIIPTPGHENFHCSVVVEDEQYGRLVIAGDVFWWWDEQEQKINYESLINHEDKYTKNLDHLRESRKQLLEIADYIIPGHGKMFKNPR